MKTTLVIDDGVMTRLREEAARQHSTLSELVEAALRRLLYEPATSARRLPPLPRYSLGRAAVDIANREALYRRMEEE